MSTRRQFLLFGRRIGVVLFLAGALGPGSVVAQKALLLGAEGAYAEVAHSPTLATPHTTIECWVKVDDRSSPASPFGEQTILDRRDSGLGYRLWVAGDDFPLPFFAFMEPGGYGTQPAVPLGNWTHVAVTQDSDSLIIYVDGERTVAAGHMYSWGSQAPLRIGEDVYFPSGSTRLTGQIDELRIWDHVRPADSIRTHLHRPVNPATAGLVLYLDFDHQEGSTVPDRSPNHNDASLMGSASLVASSAPVDFAPPPAPKGLRAYGRDEGVDVVWPSMGEEVAGFELFHGDSLVFPMDDAHRLAQLTAADTVYHDYGYDDYHLRFYRLRALDAQGHAGPGGHPTAARRVPLDTGFVTGVYYDQIYDPVSGGNRWTGRYLRDRLVPPQPPLLGHYSNRDPEIIRQHLAWMQEYGIDFLVAGWLTEQTWSTPTLRDYMLDLIAETPIRFSIMVRLSRLDQAGGDVVIDQADIDTLLHDFVYVASNFFSHPNYLTVDGRHVVFLHNSARLEGDYVVAFDAVRSAVRGLGYEMLLIGDEIRWDRPSSRHFAVLDAVTAYQPLGLPRHEGYPLDTDYFADFAVQFARWIHLSERHDVYFVPVAIPGSNAELFGAGTLTLPRQSRVGASSLSTLEEHIKVMRPFMAPELLMFMVNGFNRWQQDMQIEPTIDAGATMLDTSPSGRQYTQGYLYESYGFSALEMVRDLLAPELAVATSPEVPHPGYRQGGLEVYPNPFDGQTHVFGRISGDGPVVVDVFDVLGRRVASLASGVAPADDLRIQWDSGNLAPGVYLVRLVQEGRVESRTAVKR